MQMCARYPRCPRGEETEIELIEDCPDEGFRHSAIIDHGVRRGPCKYECRMRWNGPINHSVWAFLPDGRMIDIGS